MRQLCAAIALAAVALSAGAQADEAKTYVFDGAFDDAEFSVENAIVERGYTIDHVSHVGDMLERTKEDVGGEKTIYAGATIYLFCSAVLSRKVMEIDPMNIAHCPYAVFAMQETADGPVKIGYRTLPEGPMKEVEALLDEIARSAVE